MECTFKDYFYYSTYKYYFISPKANISDGVLEKETIDDIRNHPEVDCIKILGLNQKTFEYFIEEYGQQFKTIYFFKNKAVKNLSALSKLGKVEFIGYYFNQGCDRLWDMSGNLALKGLFINDFSKLHNLDDISTAPNLEFLSFGNMIWRKMLLDTLKPLAGTKLKYLDFYVKKIVDNDITPLAEISTLEELNFPTNLFETEQIAWLTAKLKNVKSSSLGPLSIMDEPIPWESKGIIKMKDTTIHGKGKPFLDSNLDKNRINKYVQEFEKMVREFENNS